MPKISGFSFVHNAIDGGYPIVEAVRAVYPFVDEIVVVDAQSTDGTREVLEKLGVRIIDANWGDEAGETLKKLHAQHVKCKHNLILHFEADEVFSYRLLCNLKHRISMGLRDATVYRIQVEQNFQRVREYPVSVHRLFPKGSVTKDGRTTKQHERADCVPLESGLLWDCTNVFRDNWINRCNQNAKLWSEEPSYCAVGLHAAQCFTKFGWEGNHNKDYFLSLPHWKYKETPLEIPMILRPLLGVTKYEPKI